jgi:L-amino acid N-acyltransferase YncA
MSIKVRLATVKDLEAITNIYNEAILTTDATFDTDIKTVAEQKVWFEEHGPRNPVVVAVKDNQICGWASLSKWSTRCAYSNTAEISVYIKESHRGKGIGQILINKVLILGEKVGLHTVISRITGGNAVSIHLHEKFGFEHIGTMKEVGNKFGQLLDVCMMQKIYRPKAR